MEPITYPSVTRILEATKPIEDILALENWRKKVGYEEAEKISKNALSRGKMYDSFVEDFYLHGKDIPHEALKTHLSKFKLHSLESNVVSKEFGYKGRYDCIFELNNILILNDFKGASRFKRKVHLRDYPLQLSAYINAVRESGLDIAYGMITLITDDKVQTFCFNHVEIYDNFYKFLDRLNKYNNGKTTN